MRLGVRWDGEEMVLWSGENIRLRIHLQALVSSIIPRQRRDTRSNKAHLNRLGVVHHSRIPQSSLRIDRIGQVVIEDLELVFVGVAEEDAGDGTGAEARDDGVEEGGGIWEGI